MTLFIAPQSHATVRMFLDRDPALDPATRRGPARKLDELLTFDERLRLAVRPWSAAGRLPVHFYAEAVSTFDVPIKGQRR